MQTQTRNKTERNTKHKMFSMQQQTNVFIKEMTLIILILGITLAILILITT